MREVAIKSAILPQFRGRRTAWIVAFVLSSIVIGVSFREFRPACDLMFYPTVVARNYAVAWICLFVFIGVPNKVKLVFAVVVLFWLGTRPMIEYRIPTNEHRAVWRLNEVQQKLRTETTPPKELSDLLGSNVEKTEQLSGYHFEYVPVSQGETLEHYQIGARPQCYCKTGQKSFILDNSGSMHYTSENRAATLNDPVVQPYQNSR
jgi:hypothetical protein